MKICGAMEAFGSHKWSALVVVCLTLAIDNLLQVMIVYVIPEYGLPEVPAFENLGRLRLEKTLSPRGFESVYFGVGETGDLLMWKWIVQVLTSAFSGAGIDRIGYYRPLMFGLTFLFVSVQLFAWGSSHPVLFCAECLHGFGTGLAITGGLALIAQRFTDKFERVRAFGIALVFFWIGRLALLMTVNDQIHFTGEQLPLRQLLFEILALACIVNGFLLLPVMLSGRPAPSAEAGHRAQPNPPANFFSLLVDRFVMVCAVAAMMSRFSLAFLEATIITGVIYRNGVPWTTIHVWPMWFPTFVPHVVAIVLTVRAAKIYPKYQWAMAALGLAVEGLSVVLVQVVEPEWPLALPLSGIFFGMAMLDTVLLPKLAHIVDVRYAPVYGSIYAIAVIVYSIPYAVGINAMRSIANYIGFATAITIIGVLNLLCAPLLYWLKTVTQRKIPVDPNESPSVVNAQGNGDTCGNQSQTPATITEQPVP